MESGDVPRIPLQITRDCVVASIQIDLSDDVLRRFQSDLLDSLGLAGASAVILDVSGVEVMDLEDFDALRRTMDMAALMGARPIVAGLRPGVVSSLMELDVNIENVEAARDLDDAFRIVETVPDAEEGVTFVEDDDADGNESAPNQL